MVTINIFMKKKIYIINILLFISLKLLSQANNTHIEKLQSFMLNFDTFSHINPQEKAYVHMDNTGYYLGETIWFKAYVVNANKHTPTQDSRILYVELLNPRGKILSTRKLEIVDGGCAGEFYLDPFNYDYHAGFYEIRAYTRMMLNFDSEIIYSRVFPVFNTPKKPGEYNKDMRQGGDVNRLGLKMERPKAKKQKKLNVDFYPEGGNLILGISNNIAFKATNEYGEGIDIEGKIINKKKETIVTFSSHHNGMGCFDYAPILDQEVEVIIAKEKKEYKFQLPKALSTGYLMKINPLHPQHIFIQLDKNTDTPISTLGLSITCRGQLIHFQTIKIDSTFILQLPKEELPTGVNQVTLFNSEGHIYSDRLFFISPRNQDVCYLQVKPDKDIYQPLEKIHLDIKGIPGSNISLVVRDIQHTPEINDQENILSNLLLTSDLKGYIENPSQYFSPNNEDKELHLDLLMKVQGWRRYEWKQMAGIIPFSRIHPLEKCLRIDGHIVGNSKSVKTTIILDKNKFMKGIANVDSLKKFSILIDSVIYGKYDILLESKGLIKANRNIRLDKWFSPKPKVYSFLETKFQDKQTLISWNNESDTIVTTRKISSKDYSNKSYEIAEVKVNRKRGKDLIYEVETDKDKAIDSGNYFPEQIFYYLINKDNGFYFKSHTDPSKDNEIGSGKFYWHNKGLSANIVTNQNKWEKVWKSKRHPTMRGNKVLFEDINNIYKIIIREWDTPSPLILCYPHTKTAYSTLRKSIFYRISSFTGFSKIKDFYEDRIEREKYVPVKNEYSRILYWNPNIKLNETGKAHVEFHNNNFCKKIEISTVGIEKTGILIINK